MEEQWVLLKLAKEEKQSQPVAEWRDERETEKGNQPMNYVFVCTSILFTNSFVNLRKALFRDNTP